MSSAVLAQLIILQDDPALAMYLDCLTNCGPMLNPSQRLALRVYCTDCAGWVYAWTMTPGVVIPPAANSRQVLILPANTIQNAKYGDCYLVSVQGEYSTFLVNNNNNHGRWSHGGSGGKCLPSIF